MQQTAFGCHYSPKPSKVDILMWKQPTLSMHTQIRNSRQVKQNTAADNVGYKLKTVGGMGFQHIKSVGATLSPYKHLY
jgi:hypothetical protein